MCGAILWHSATAATDRDIDNFFCGHWGRRYTNHLRSAGNLQPKMESVFGPFFLLDRSFTPAIVMHLQFNCTCNRCASAVVMHLRFNCTCSRYASAIQLHMQSLCICDSIAHAIQLHLKFRPHSGSHRDRGMLAAAAAGHMLAAPATVACWQPPRPWHAGSPRGRGLCVNVRRDREIN